MTADDVEPALEMFAAVAAEGRWVGTEADADWVERRVRWRASLGAPTHRSVVAVCNGDVVGSAGVDVTGYGVAEIGMAIAPAWRGHGLGGELLDGILEQARDLGAHKVALQVWPHNARALALNRGRGFREEGRLVRHYRRSTGELWDAVVMGLVLDTESPGSPFGDEPLIG